MKKRRFLFLAINLIAAGGIALSGYMTWLGGYAPQSIGIGEILPFDLPNQMMSFYTSVLSVILVGAVFVGVGGLFMVKSMVWFGMIISAGVAGCWIWHFGFDANGLGLDDGFSLFAASFLLIILSLYLHRNRRSSERKRGRR